MNLRSQAANNAVTLTSRSNNDRRKPKVAFYETSQKAPVHILIDSSGLNVHVGQMRKPPKNRDWRKIHLAVDEQTGDVLACDLTSKSAHDSARVPALLKQIDRDIASARADTAYDTVGVYQAIENHRDGRSPRVLIPPRKGAKLAPTSTAARERNRTIRAQARLGKRTWHTASGIRLQQTEQGRNHLLPLQDHRRSSDAGQRPGRAESRGHNRMQNSQSDDGPGKAG